MQGEWIKMRAVLLRHPKVIAMSDYLAAQPDFVRWLAPGRDVKTAYEVVTRECVTRVTVASLLAFWCDANSVTSDCHMPRHATRHTCDIMAGVPCFGDALVHVEWLQELPDNGGLILPNFQEFNTDSKQRSSGAARTAAWRERKKQREQGTASHDASQETSHVTPERRKEGRKEVLLLTSPNGEVAETRVPACPHAEIIAAYHEALPMGRRVNVELWNGTRKTHLQARWREKPARQNLEWWKRFFAYCAESEFLTGRVPPTQGRKQFEVSLDWLIKPENFAKVIEGAYSQ